jgi:glycosyltransferase involved in cell wall biosynthesis
MATGVLAPPGRVCDGLGMPELTISVVVSTIGLDHRIERLVSSVAEQAHPGVEIVVVDQSGGADVAACLDRVRDEVPIRYAAMSVTGASRGRNTGARMAAGEIVTFPDDDCWYESGALAAMRDLATLQPAVSAWSGRLMTPEGPSRRLRFGPTPRALDRRSVWRSAIEPTLLLRRGDLLRAGGFSEDLGPGAGTAWGAGEGTDLLLRWLEAGLQVRYEPSLEVWENDPRDMLTPPGYRAKVRSYARAGGQVYRRHQYSRLDQALLVTRPVLPLVLAAARGDADEVRARGAAIRGRVRGLLDRPPSFSHYDLLAPPPPPALVA